MVSVKSWVEISEQRLAGNFAALQRVVNADRELSFGELTSVLAVIKAKAYGHGIVPCAAILANSGAEWLGVTDALEGATVREALTAAGVTDFRQPKILVMCGTAALPGEAELIVEHRLTPVVWSLHHLEALARIWRKAGGGAPLNVHLEVDTGMSRQGVLPGAELDGMLAALRSAPGLVLDGVMTHFASTEAQRAEQTAPQEHLFEAAIAQVAPSGLTPKWVHVGNSSYIDNGAGKAGPMPWLRALAASVGARSMVRSGIALYGYLLPLEGRAEPSVAPIVRPVMTWKTRVIGLHGVPAGARIGYSGVYVAERAMRLALLPVGYADGLRRELSSTNAKAGGWVMIRNRRAAIVGRVSMNLVSVDVSGIDDVAEGDEAVLLGEGITADDHASLAETIAYEIICGVRTH